MKRWIAVLLAGLMLLMAGCAAAPEKSAPVAPNYGAMPPVEREAGGTEAQAPGAGGTSSSALPEGDLRMVIYNGTLELVVTDTLETQQAIGQLMGRVGGYIEASTSYNYGENRITVDMTLRVPAEQFNATMDTLRGMATEVRRDSVASQDVGQEYVDLESRLHALELRAQKLEEFLKQAQDTDGLLRIYNELSATQVEIEQVKGRMKYLERMVAMATITVKLIPDELAQPLELPGWHPDATAKKAVEMLVRTLQVLVTVLIWLVLYLLPVLLIVGAFIYAGIRLILFIIYRASRRRKS